MGAPSAGEVDEEEDGVEQEAEENAVEQNAVEQDAVEQNATAEKAAALRRIQRYESHSDRTARAKRAAAGTSYRVPSRGSAAVRERASSPAQVRKQEDELELVLVPKQEPQRGPSQEHGREHEQDKTRAPQQEQEPAHMRHKAETASTSRFDLRSLFPKRSESDNVGKHELPAAVTASVSDPTDDETLLLQLLNVERTARGLKPLAWDGMLTNIARQHALDMLSVRKMSHKSSRTGANYEARLAKTSYRATGAAENVAFNSSVLKAHRALMNSAGHRRNILDPDLTAVGTAVATDPNDGWVYVVQDFATPISHVSDEEAVAALRRTILDARSRTHALDFPEDTSASRSLGRKLEAMIKSGGVRETFGGGPGWTMAFTSMDPAATPPGALDHIARAESYAIAVKFQKSRKYPFGTYWAIVFLKGEYAGGKTGGAEASTRLARK